eukprot:GFUD01036545.1.p1 GENE.GFUD01036545.1~~GFUD01036545.1.p1  ORF type:complete len:893 (-),score=233.50 GFUD01036545.1:245-2923(-)
MEKMSLLAVAMALLGSATAGPLLGGSKCTWGPSYWCANIPQASECSAVKHCVAAVWQNEKVPQDDDEVCKICKDMVGQARDTLMSNETQEELKEVLEGSCDLIPLAIIAKECKTLSDQFIPELIETLASEMNPDTVCTVAGLCNSERIDKMLEKVEMQGVVQYGGDCNICRQGARKTKLQLQKMTQDQVEDRMLELCGYTGSFSNACMETALEESDGIYKMLTEQFNEEICDLSGLCSQSFEKVPATIIKEGEDIQCEFCEKVIKHWLDVYASNASLAEFKAMMDGICEKLDKKNSVHCKHIVDDYYIPAFEFLRNELDPHMLCSVVGLCGNSGFLQIPVSSKAPAISMVKLQPANHVNQNSLVKSYAALNGPLYVPSSVVQTNSPTCVLCEYVLHELQQYIKDGQTEAQIKKTVEAICDQMPGVIKKECKDFVDTYEPAIVAFLVNEIEPTQVCPMLHLCDQQEKMNNLEATGLISLKSDSSCEMCEFAMDEVFSILKNKDDQDMVKNALESICYRLPNSIERNCEDFVEKYTSSIINLIVTGLTADEVCAALDLCASTEVGSVQTVPTPVEVGDSTCILCEYVITTIDSMLEDKANEAQIKAALETVCSILPKSIEKQCDNFVVTYTDIIIDMLTKDVTPEMVCSNLGLCKAKGNVVMHQVVLEDPKDPYCSLCELVVRDLDGMLEDKQNKEEIEKALDVLCFQLSDPVHKQCEKMVAKYTDEIIEMFIKEYSPKEICAELGLCVDNEINTNDIFEVKFEEPIVQDKVGCAMCEFAMSLVDEHLKDTSTIDEIERMIQFVCSYLPGTIDEKCEDLVDVYGQKIIEALVDDEMNPKDVCAQILPDCATTSLKTCLWGPEYWCATPFHAKACGATQHCQTTVWKGLGITGLN